MAVSKLTGKAGTLTYANTVLTITKWSANVNKDFADSTDSSDYDSNTTHLVWKEQLASGIAIEGDIEGYWDTTANTGTNAFLMSYFFSANAAADLALKLDASTVFASGNADLTNFKIEVAVNEAKTTGFTASYKSNGIWTQGA